MFAGINRMKELFKNPPWVVAKALADHIPGRPIQIQRLSVLILFGEISRSDPSFGCVRDGIPSDVFDMSLLESKDADSLIQRFRDGMSCAVAVRENRKIIGYQWYSSNPSHLEELTGYPVEIPRDSIYAYDAFVDPECRQQGIWLQIQAHLLKRAGELGRKNIIALVDPTNNASLKAHTRCGYLIVRDVLCFRVISKWFYRERDALALPPHL